MLRNYTAPNGRRGDVVVVRDPSQLRDPRARFNPAKRNSRDLMASILAGGGAALPLTDGPSPD